MVTSYMIKHIKLDSIQYNAALAITGTISGASKEKLYDELRFETLQKRRWCRKLCCFFKIFRYKLSILIKLCFRFRYIENIMLYLNGGVLIYMYKQSNTVYCLSHLHSSRGCTTWKIKFCYVRCNSKDWIDNISYLCFIFYSHAKYGFKKANPTSFCWKYAL